MAVVLMAGLSTALAGPADATFRTGHCSGMSAPQNDRVDNQAPVLTNDSAKVVAGDLIAIKVLANDSDPESDKLYVVNGSKPTKGETCISGTGVLEYWSSASSASYTQVIRYGVTDGDEYRTATVTVNVEGVKPMRAQLKKRLLLRKGGHKVKRRAVVAFTNRNQRTMTLLAGNPNKARPSIRRAVKAGQSTTFRTKLRRVAFVVARRDSAGDLTLVNLGSLNTRNGRQHGMTAEDFEEDFGGSGTSARTFAGTSSTPATGWLN